MESKKPGLGRSKRKKGNRKKRHPWMGKHRFMEEELGKLGTGIEGLGELKVGKRQRSKANDIQPKNCHGDP